MAKDFTGVIDDNRTVHSYFTPKTGQRLTGIDSTTMVFSTSDTALIRIVADAAINYIVTNVTTTAVTTSDAYLPAATIEYVKVVRGVDRIAFVGSTVVHIVSVE